MKFKVDSKLLESLLTLATVIEARDAYTGGHTWRVSRYGEELARGLGLSEDEIFVIRVGGLVHDIGKVGVPDAVLNKPGPLAEEEMRVMREHPRIGRSVIASHPLSPLIFAAVTEHHERPDGTGYPDRTGAEGMSVYGSIISIADAFDAMTSTRPYRVGMAAGKAATILREHAGTQFDAAMADRFVSLLDAGRFAHILDHANDTRLMLACMICGPIIAPRSDTKEGDTLQCPHCTGLFRAHTKGSSFDLEPTGVMTGVYAPVPDSDAVRSVLKDIRKEIRILA